MGLLDRFRRKSKDTTPKRGRADADALKKQFQAVPAVGKDGKTIGASKPAAASAPKDAQEKQPKEKKAKKDRIKREDTGDAYRILIEPVISEKSAMLGSLNQYAFAVASSANKRQVGDAVHRVYGVTPTQVRIVHVHGKTVRRGRSTGVTSDWKKAIVTIKAGEKIEFYEGN
ncbi:MAG: 50S ribosomal protein L23 [Candidatus Kerfeldbacteria bacterium]|nr:50S ribosomal protein L23 [Candidatus Kerfeldbacteria bacterium]